MKRVGKPIFHQPGDSIYNALLREDEEAVNQFLEKGEKIPELLYMQTTNHDNLSLLKFLLSFQPEKKQFALKSSFVHGAIECFSYLKTISSQTELDELKQLTPRKNSEAINSALRNVIGAEEIDSHGTLLASEITPNF